MHDREARPTGAVKSAEAIANEMMILLNIDLRIAQVRPRVEESVHRGGRDAALRRPNSAACCPYDLAVGFHLHFSKHFARKKRRISSTTLRREL
jgi:hypothetical protein